jgi:hypothetical protein
MLSLAGVLFAARPAAAQVLISPDRTLVYIGSPPPVLMQSSFNVTPVVVPGNQYVRIGGTFSATVITPTTTPGFGFVKPFYANDRAKGANFYGSPNYNPRPVIAAPFRAWW